MNLDAMMEGFHFLRPWWWLLLPVLLLILWYLRRVRLQSRRWQSVCDAALLPHLLISESGASQRRGILLLVGLAGLLAITALAGPAWKQLEQPVFRDQSALVLLLDLSRSMDATDVRPTRLTRARLKLIDILKQRKEGQTALIVYAADAFIVSPLTEDAATIIAQVSSLETALMPQQGSRPDLAIDMAQQLLVQAGAARGDLLLISDGLENVPQEVLSDSIETLKQAGYRLSILGVGSAEGAPIALPDGGFLKNRSGDIVIPRLDEAGLRELVQQGGGHYQAMRVDGLDIAALLSASQFDGEVSLEASQGFKADQWREEGPWLLLLLLPLVLVAFRRGQLLLVCIVVVPLTMGHVEDAAAENIETANVEAAAASQSWWDNLWSTPDQRAARAFEHDDVAQAAALFNDKAWQAAANYRKGDYQQTIDALDGIENAEALYNKGNAYAQLKQWQAALDAYDQALSLQPKHEDAQYNRELVQQQLQQASDDAQSDNAESGSSEERGEPLQQGEPQQSDSQQGAPQSGESGDAESSDESSSASDGMDEVPQPSESSQGENDDQNRQMSEGGGDESGEEAQQATQSPAEESEGEAQPDKPAAASASELSEAQAEIQQANDQWLRRIPDDPGGLLRRKFQYQSQRAKNRSGGQPPVEDKSW